MALERAGEHGVEALAALGPVAAQPFGLPMAEVAELVVVVGAKRRLAMAYEVKGSHGRIVRRRAATGSRASDGRRRLRCWSPRPEWAGCRRP